MVELETEVEQWAKLAAHHLPRLEIINSCRKAEVMIMQADFLSIEKKRKERRQKVSLICRF